MSSRSSFAFSLLSLPLSMLLLLLLLLLSFFTPPSFSTSRGGGGGGGFVHQYQNNSLVSTTGFRVTLTHFDFGKNLTKFERIQRGIKRGKYRLQKFTAMVLAESNDVDTPVLVGNGEFLMELAIGTPPEKFNAILDTGSDLIWTQCKPCKECFNQPSHIFDPKKSSSFSTLSCSSDLCEALPQSKCSGGSCEYLYLYGDYSSTEGVLASETFTFGEVSIPNVGFGCGEDNEGDGFSQGSGLVGLGRGPLSLVSQLKEPKFSYCLASIDEAKTSTLLMGSLANVNEKSGGGAIKTTPLIRNLLQPSFYYLSLEGISVGGTRLPIKKSTFALQDDGSGGLIIDSGTTITYLEESAFEVLKKEFVSKVDLPVDTSGSTGLDLCFTLPSESSSVEMPKLELHFEGADLELPGENYLVADSNMGVICLAMGGSSGMSILGNVQQQNLLVLHDLVKETLSFLPTQCDRL